MKILGITIWCVAFAMFTIQLFQNESGIAFSIIMVLALLVYLPLLLYSWLFGHQKGHKVHFTVILLVANLSILIFFRNSIPIMLYAVCIGAYIIIMFLMVRKYRPSFIADFKNKIKCDHFTGLSTRF